MLDALERDRPCGTNRASLGSAPQTSSYSAFLAVPAWFRYGMAHPVQSIHDSAPALAVAALALTLALLVWTKAVIQPVLRTAGVA